MICPKCGISNYEGSTFCLYCGADLSDSLYGSSADTRLLMRALGDMSFLVVTVLVTLFAAASFAAGVFNVPGLAVAAGLWVLFFASLNNSKGLLGVGTGIVSVSVRIQHIFNYVLAGVLFVLGIISLIVFICEGDMFAIVGDSIGDGISETFIAFELIKNGALWLSSLAGGGDRVICGIAVMIGFFIAALVVLILNLWFTRCYDGYLSSISSAVSRKKSVKLCDTETGTCFLINGILFAVVTVACVVWLIFNFSLGALMLTLSQALLSAVLIISRFSMN